MKVILHSLIASLHQFPPNRHLRYAEAYVLLGCARLALFILPFHRIALLLGQCRTPKSTPPSGKTPMETKTVRSIAQAIDYSACKLPGHSTCLVRAIAGQWMLRRRGLSGQLYLGVRKDGNSMKAHAWVTIHGKPAIGSNIKNTYNPIACFESNRPINQTVTFPLSSSFFIKHRV